jgi:hypothetical protein
VVAVRSRCVSILPLSTTVAEFFSRLDCILLVSLLAKSKIPS